MTTKNPEYIFDLQAFAEQSHTDGPTPEFNSDTWSDVATVGASSGSIYVNGGWALTDTGVTVSSWDDADTDAGTDTTYSHTDTFKYHAFSSTDTSSAAVYVSEKTTTTDTQLSTTLQAPPSGFINDTIVASPITLTGTGGTPDLVLNGIGSIKAFNSNSNVVLQANTNALNMTGVYGSAALTIDPTVSGSNGVFNQNVNGAAINAAVASGNTFTFTGNDERNAVTVAATADVTLNAIDTAQTWQADSSNGVIYHRLQVEAANSGDTIAVTGAGTVGNYLAVTTGDDNVAVNVSTVGSGAITDTVVVNGTVLGGAGAMAAQVNGGTGSLMTVKAGSNGGLLSAGANASGGAASLAAGAEAVLSTVDGGVAISAVAKVKLLLK